MKKNFIPVLTTLHATGAMLLALTVGACGGGGSESGPVDTVEASPSAVQVTGAPGSCAQGVGPTIFVHGGTPPYTLYNSGPTAMVLSTSQLEHSGDGVSITFINGVCMEAIPVTAEDAMGRLVRIPITNSKGV